jgi:glutathione synthase
MSAPYSFLVLTDHRVHKAQNPVYHLLPALRANPHCGSIHIASRGNPENEPFFAGCRDVPLALSPVEENFRFDPSGEFFQQCTVRKSLQEFDVVLMRLARPVPDDFLGFLAQAAKGKLLINHPAGIHRTSNKTFLLQFPDLCPPMKLCRSVAEVEAFARQFAIVLKPLREYGGKGIVRMDGDQVSLGNEKIPVSSFLQQQKPYIQTEGYLAMQFLKNVDQGDKRLVVVGGEIVAAALRLPPEGSWLCNVAQGGRSVIAYPTPEEKNIVARLNPVLSQEGIFIYGVDTLVNDDGKRVLSEINTLSVGGFLPAEEQSGQPVIQPTIQKIMAHVDRFYS